MAKTITADDLLSLIASLTPRERMRLLRMIVLTKDADGSPAGTESLAWEAEGREDVG